MPGLLLRAAYVVALGSSLFALVAETLARRGRSRVPIAAFIADRFARAHTSPSWMVFGVVAGAAVVVCPVAAGSAAGVLTWHAVAWPPAAAGLVVVTLFAKTAFVVFEELAFRGALTERLRAAGTPAAVAASALAFALAHSARADAAGWMVFAVWALDGAGFAIAYIATGSLRAPVAWHLAKNVSVWLVFGTSTLQWIDGPGAVAYRQPSSWWGGPGATGLVDVIAALIAVAGACALAAAERGAAARIEGGSRAAERV